LRFDYCKTHKIFVIVHEKFFVTIRSCEESLVFSRDNKDDRDFWDRFLNFCLLLSLLSLSSHKIRTLSNNN
jgi:hypothetical protein